MDIFADVVRGHHGLLLDAVVRAASELGVFRLFREPSGGPSPSRSDIASRLGLPTRRLDCLVNVLLAEGVLTRGSEEEPDGLLLPSLPSSSHRPAGQWDRMADAIAADRPLELDPAWLEGHLDYVAQKARVVAPLLWRRLAPEPGTRLLDMGGGLGAFSMAFLLLHPANSATLLDLSDVVSLVKARSSAPPAGLTVVEGDARKMHPSPRFDLVLLANVLHLYGPGDCRRIVRNAASSLAPGGSVIIWDLAISPDRTGPLVSLYFALNMAIFTEAGEVHSSDQITRWLSEAGMDDVTQLAIPECPYSLCLAATRKEA